MGQVKDHIIHVCMFPNLAVKTPLSCYIFVIIQTAVQQQKMGSRIGGKMTSTVRVTPGISRYKVVWRVVEVSTELREIHARRRPPP